MLSTRLSLGASRPWISLLARLGLAATWLWAGWAKIQDPATSAYAVRVFRILPEGLINPVGYGLPALELGLAVLLLIGLCTRFTAIFSAALFLLFMAAIIQAWARGLSIDCGCFGGGGEVDPAETQYTKEILRDIGFLAMSIWLVCRPSSHLSLDVRLR
ncbi:MauE/DoxX family redox-associated membrane protein [Streptomyces klenkii]|uniref:MauE/DoxX family redox-associated membrane protein n=1 Tax=Streptomyces klenkii TaxID=1420899 RepID=UPI0033A6FAF6